MAPTKVLITGSSGYVGHFLINALLGASSHDRGDDDPTPPFFVYGCTFRQGAGAVPTAEFSERCAALVVDGLDATSVAKAVETSKPDVVVNLMAIASPEECEKDPDHAHKLNVPASLLSAMQEHAPNALLVSVAMPDEDCGAHCSCVLVGRCITAALRTRGLPARALILILYGIDCCH